MAKQPLVLGDGAESPRARPSSHRARRQTTTADYSSPVSASPLGGTPEYEHVRLLGKGAFGKVTMVKCSVTGEPAAMKTIERARLVSPALKKTVQQEVRALKRLHRHRSVIRLYEIVETPHAFYIVMEYLSGGNLDQLVRAHKRLDEALARPLVSQMLDAVEHCHAHRLCHRDLKLENFVLDHTRTRIKLIDFGLSVIWKKDSPELHRSYGTPCYSAPEIIGGQPYLGERVDVWSLGVAVFAMLVGELPFRANTSAELKRRVLGGRYTLPQTLSAEACDFVSSMLTLEPRRRIELNALRTHLWLIGEAASLDEQQASPLDRRIISRLETLGVSCDAVEHAIEHGIFNRDRACYELARKQLAVEREAPQAGSGHVAGTAAVPS